MEVQYVSHCLIFVLALSHVFFFGPMELLHDSHCLLWLLAVSHSLSKFKRVAASFSHSPEVAGCLLQCLPVPCSCRISLTVTNCFWLFIFVSSNAMEFLAVSHCLPLSSSVSLFLPFFDYLSLFHWVAKCLSQSLAVACCLSTPLNWERNWETASNNERQWETFSNFVALWETVRDSQQQLERVRDMRNLHGTGRYCE